MRANAAVSVYLGRPSPRVTTWEKEVFDSDWSVHSNLWEETKRKNNAVELPDPEGVDRHGGGDQGPGEQGGVHPAFQRAGNLNIRITYQNSDTPPFRKLKQIFGIQCQIIRQHLSKQEKTPVKLSSLVALHGEHVGEEFVAWYVCNRKLSKARNYLGRLNICNRKLSIFGLANQVFNEQVGFDRNIWGLLRIDIAWYVCNRKFSTKLSEKWSKTFY